MVDPLTDITHELHRRNYNPPAGNVIGSEVYEWCPFHPDGAGKPPHKPSLRINTEKECWYCDPCGEGGTLTDLMDRLGLRRNGEHPDGIVATYDYRDAQGKVWGQVCRTPSKQFPCRRPDGKGDWLWKWTDEEGNDLVTRTLYRLPELLAADPADWVFCVEGEKDADRLASLGLVATCNPGGASKNPNRPKWRDGYSASLRGRRVAVVPDHDEAGRAHAEATARSLAGVAAEVRIVELPAQEIGDDVSDFLDRGGSKEALLAKVQAAPKIHSPGLYIERENEKFVTAAEFMKRSPEGVPWLAKPWVVTSSITMISGKPKLAGKTTFTLHLAKAVLDGGTFLGEQVEQSSVIYLTEERRPTFANALRRVGLENSEDLMIRQHSPGDGWPDVVRETLTKAERVGARLIVVDTLPQFADIKADGENAAGNAREALEPFSRAEGVAVVVDFHDRKAGGDPGDAARGSNQFAGAVDIIVHLNRLPHDGHERRREIVAVGRFDEVPDRVIIELRDDGYRLLGDRATVALDDAKDAVSSALAGGESLTEEELLDGLKGEHKKTTAGQALRQMLEAGQVTREGAGKKGDPYKYSLT